MPKTIVQNVIKQLKQLGEETLETGKKQLMGEMAGGTPVQSPVQEPEKINLQEMEARDEAKSRQIVKRLRQGLEMEVAKQRQIREQQLQQRRQPMEPPKTEQLPPPQLPSKPKRGLFGMPRRIKSAQQQSQPELSGRRVGG